MVKCAVFRSNKPTTRIIAGAAESWTLMNNHFSNFVFIFVEIFSVGNTGLVGWRGLGWGMFGGHDWPLSRVRVKAWSLFDPGRDYQYVSGMKLKEQIFFSYRLLQYTGEPEMGECALPLQIGHSQCLVMFVQTVWLVHCQWWGQVLGMKYKLLKAVMFTVRSPIVKWP